MALEQICGYQKRRYAKGFEPITHNQLKVRTVNFRNPCQLLAPPFPNLFGGNRNFAKQNHSRIGIEHGTTTLGFIFQGGIVLCADSRGTTGNFVGSQDMKKIMEFNKYMLGTMAGGAGDCAYWDRVIMRESRLHELRFKKPLPVNTATRMICNVANQYRGLGLMMGMMLAGWGPDGPQLSYVDSDGLRMYGSSFAVGSGASVALGALDMELKYNMTNEMAFELAERAVYLATYRDAFSGGLVRLYHIDQNGWTLISNTDCKQLHTRFMGHRVDQSNSEQEIYQSGNQPETDV